MAYKIRWTAIALEDYERVVDYLIKMWSVNVATDFEGTVNKKLANLSGQPFMGIASKKKPMVRSISLTKHNRLYYRITDNTIELLNIFGTRQNPEKNSF
ncbi:MAG: type II toxin-antitoxin system RelE/ParE family toxin [Chitinophagaceae bacterium]|nr:type II toxin-antitoxin system RelE/ParE family toxin [Chitinophagaceae bacterium]